MYYTINGLAKKYNTGFSYQVLRRILLRNNIPYIKSGNRVYIEDGDFCKIIFKGKEPKLNPNQS